MLQGWVSPDYIGNTRQSCNYPNAMVVTGSLKQVGQYWMQTGAIVATGGSPAGTTDEAGNYVPLTADLDGTYTL